MSGGTANGVVYLNTSKVATSGTALVFDGTNLGVGVTPSTGWNTTNNKAIQVSTYGSISSNNSQGTCDVAYNCYNSTAQATLGWKYRNTSALASLYQQLNGIHAWHIAPAGTADAGVTFTQAMTLDASGRLGIGTTSPLEKLSVSGAVLSSGQLQDLRASTLSIDYNSSDAVGRIVATGANSSTYAPIVFASTTTTTYAERARIDSSGNLLVGQTSGTSYKLSLKTSSASQSAIGTAGTSGDTAFQAILITKFDNDSTTSQNFIQFQINNGGANCGKITANGANTAAFGSTSDQRVKENIVELPSQLANIMALRPVEFDYLESYGGGHQIGFIAQEMQQVYPDVISTDDSSEQIMSITGWSKTEARLVKAIQEQQALINQLTARITALENK